MPTGANVVMQHKTRRPVQFDITPATRRAVQKWIKQAGLNSEDVLFPSCIHGSPHLGTRQYESSMKATLICRRTKNLRAVPGRRVLQSALLEGQR